MMKRSIPWLVSLLYAAAGNAMAQDALGMQQTPPVQPALRVCADPNNLPFSNSRQEGFENRLAELVAAELDMRLEYTWMPQRRGFIRRTLGAGKCDLVMGMPEGYEEVLTSTPYYRSTYVFVQRSGDGAAIASFDDPALRDMKIGLHAIGDDGANPPPVYALARRGIVHNIQGYKMWDVDTVDSPAGRIIDAVANGDIDLAIVWGPYNYFASRQTVTLRTTPVTPPDDKPAFPFSYEISMGMRKNEYARKAEIDAVVKRRREAISAILQAYRIPVDGPARLEADRSADVSTQSRLSTGELR
jgi:mxaJ protein